VITAVDYATSKALAYPIVMKSAEDAAQLLEEIVWTYGRPKEIITDNGAEFIGNLFQATLKRYGIEHNRTSPGHPQTNGKVERLNHELVQRLQRIAAEDNNDRMNWDLYLRQAVFAFHAHTNKRTGSSPFYLQHGVEPILPSTAFVSEPITRLELAEATEARRKYVQNLDKYRSDAQKRYQTALERLADKHDDQAFLTGTISPGDLVMREPINRESKLHPKWDGPFVVVATTDYDVYQLASANGYIVRNLVNASRLRKLTRSEAQQYTDEFWAASKRLQTQNKRAKNE